MFIEIPIANTKKTALVNVNNITTLYENRLKQTEIYTSGNHIITTSLSLEDIKKLLEKGLLYE